MTHITTLDTTLALKVLSVPTVYRHEIGMQMFLMRHAIENGYHWGKDAMGNIYFTKGTVAKDEFYPCLTAHIDTVQHWQKPLAQDCKSLELITEVDADGLHRVRCEGKGLGGDDKAGVAVVLSIIDRLPACKAVFFVEEEIGCKGSLKVDEEWLADVGYIIAFDAPGRNRASWACNGVRLFDREFFDSHLAPLEEKFGITNYQSDPYTDVAVLRPYTDVACMNFGTGYYHQHTDEEYVVLEDMDHAARLGIYLAEQLGHQQYLIFCPPTILDPIDIGDEDYAYFAARFGERITSQ
ncbi:MAG: hypothetical protein Q4B68_00115 [Bacteroidales bacterium]|nr:hypothetical protein [Bacteroidales bacterium]